MPADVSALFWCEGPNYGRFEFMLSPCGHALRRFQERIRPDLDLTGCHQEIVRLNVSAFRKIKSVPTRRNRRNDPSWYLKCDYDPPVTLIARPYLSEQDNGFVSQVYRVITVLAGHEHY